MMVALQKEGKELVGRFFQLQSGHAAIGSYPAEGTKTIPSSACWLCVSGERQSRFHFFPGVGGGLPKVRRCGEKSAEPAGGSTLGPS